MAQNNQIPVRPSAYQPSAPPRVSPPVPPASLAARALTSPYSLTTAPSGLTASVVATPKHKN